MKHSVKKVLETRGVSEFGYEVAKEIDGYVRASTSTFGYGNLVVDMRSLL